MIKLKMLTCNDSKSNHSPCACYRGHQKCLQILSCISRKENLRTIFFSMLSLKAVNLLVLEGYAEDTWNAAEGRDTVNSENADS